MNGGKSMNRKNVINALENINAVNTELLASSNNNGIPKINNLAFQYNNNVGYVANGFRYIGVEIIGETDEIFEDTKTQMGRGIPMGGQYYNHPEGVEELLEVASTDADDTSGGDGARVVTLVGLNASYELVVNNVTLNGVLPVTTSDPFNFLLFYTVKESGDQTFSGQPNQGLISIAPASASWTVGGLPTDITLLMGQMGIGIGTAFLGQYLVPPSGQLFINQLVVSTALEGNQTSGFVEITFNVQTNGESGWKQGARLLTTSALPTLGLQQDSFPDINFSSTPGERSIIKIGIDIKNPPVQFDGLATVYMTAVLVVPES
jgi:hypothetical protein